MWSYLNLTVLPVAVLLSTSARALEGGDRAPFESNMGQTDDRVDFLSRGRDHTVYLSATEVVLVFAGTSETARALRMTIVGGAPGARGTGQRPRTSRSHYFIGRDSRRWRTDVPHYGRVFYREIYPGIDAAYYREEGGRFEFDFVLHPGADPALIRLDFEGADAMAIGDDGELVLEVDDARVVYEAPSIYQTRDGEVRTIPGRFRLSGTQVAFELGDYDPSRPLVIDPVLSYSTYLGGANIEHVQSLVVDPAGNAYLVGTSSSGDYPITTGGGPIGRDAFVTKLSPTGQLVYSTFVGATNSDWGYGAAVDASGSVYLTGYTFATNFPTTPGAYQEEFTGIVQDAFLVKLSPSGSSLEYATYIGGRDFDQGYDVAVDASGMAYVVGQTRTGVPMSYFDFPTSAGAFQTTFGGGFNDAFVLKFNPSGTDVVYATLLGGVAGELAYGVDVDAGGHAYVTGLTTSSDFPTSEGAVQPECVPVIFGNGCTTEVFVTKLESDGSDIVYSTYLGGGGNDEGLAIAVDVGGNAYITGKADGPAVGRPFFPTTPGAFQGAHGSGVDAFVTKLDPAGSAFVYSTLFGLPHTEGGGVELARDIALDGSGVAYITGQTNADGFPITPGAVQSTIGASGRLDAFVASFDPSGSELRYSTYLGGFGKDEGFGIGVDALGNIYVGGTTESEDFPTVNPLQSELNRLQDAFVARISDPNPMLAPADLTTSKTNGHTVTVPGTTTTYDVVVTNRGPSHLVGGILFEHFDGAQFDTNNIRWTCVPGFGLGTTCPASGFGLDLTRGIVVDIEANDDLTFVIDAPVRPSASGMLTNTAWVNLPAGYTDSDRSNNVGTDTDRLIVGCGAPLDLHLENETLTSSDTIEACGSITTGSNVAIQSPAEATFRAGLYVALGNGFVVESGASFVAELDPALAQ